MSIINEDSAGDHYVGRCNKMCVIWQAIFLKENVCNLTPIRLIFHPEGQIDNESALWQVMVWCLLGTTPLRESMLTKDARCLGRDK